MFVVINWLRSLRLASLPCVALHLRPVVRDPRTLKLGTRFPLAQTLVDAARRTTEPRVTIQESCKYTGAPICERLAIDFKSIRHPYCSNESNQFLCFSADLSIVYKRIKRNFLSPPPISARFSRLSTFPHALQA